MPRPDWPHDDDMPGIWTTSWTTSPGATPEPPRSPTATNHARPESVSEGHFDELLRLRADKARIGAMLVDTLAVLEEMNAALARGHDHGRDPQTKEYHRAVMRAVKEEVKKGNPA